MPPTSSVPSCRDVRLGQAPGRYGQGWRDRVTARRRRRGLIFQSSCVRSESYSCISTFVSESSALHSEYVHARRSRSVPRGACFTLVFDGWGVQVLSTALRIAARIVG